MAFRKPFRSRAASGTDGSKAKSPGGAQQAVVLGLRWIGARELSAAQVRERLARRGFEAIAIDEALERLSRGRVVDDSRVARSAVRVARDIKHHGPHRIARDLERRGIPRDVASAAVTEMFADQDQSALLERALDRRLRGSIDSPAQFRRLYQYLARQGFPSDLVVRTLKLRTKRP